MINSHREKNVQVLPFCERKINIELYIRQENNNKNLPRIPNTHWIHDDTLPLVVDIDRKRKNIITKVLQGLSM